MPRNHLGALDLDEGDEASDQVWGIDQVGKMFK